jgi:hypothetical protein
VGAWRDCGGGGVSDTDIHAFQGIVTKLRTTTGSPFALDVMAEAADEIERQAGIIKAFEDAWNMTHFSCDNPDHAVAYREMAVALGYLAVTP